MKIIKGLPRKNAVAIQTQSIWTQVSYLSGFTLIEIIIALGLAALILPAIAYVYSFSLTTSTQGGKYSQAYTLAQENMEAVYYLKETDWDWTASSPENTDPGEYYQPIKDGSGNWTLNSIVTVPVKGTDGYTRTIEIYPVYRNGSGAIDPSGTSDPETRKITSTVSWEMNGSPESLKVSSYVTKH